MSPSIKSFADLVNDTVAHLEPRPRMVSFEAFTSFGDAIVVLSDGPVLWQLIRERGNVTLDAASVHAPEEWYEAEFLERVMLGEPETPASPGGPPAQAPLSSAIARLEKLRERVLASFGSVRTWQPVREQVKDIQD